MKKYNNYVNGIMLMVCSVMVTFFLMLMIDWSSRLGLMQNLSMGAIITFEDFHGQCSRYVTNCGDLIVYFKYAVIFKFSSFLFGLHLFLISQKQHVVSSENA